MLPDPARTAAAISAAALVIALATGCTAPSGATAGSPTTAPDSAVPRASASGAAPITAGAGFGTDPQAPAESAFPSPPVDRGAEDAARAAAVQAMILYARPGLDPGKWLQDLHPVAMEEFIKENATVNPRFVGAASVRGAGDWVMDPANLYTVQVPVTTDGGVFIVQLHRNGAQAPWLVRYVIPPTLRGTP